MYMYKVGSGYQQGVPWIFSSSTYMWKVHLLRKTLHCTLNIHDAQQCFYNSIRMGSSIEAILCCYMWYTFEQEDPWIEAKMNKSSLTFTIANETKKDPSLFLSVQGYFRCTVFGNPLQLVPWSCCRISWFCRIFMGFFDFHRTFLQHPIKNPVETKNPIKNPVKRPLEEEGANHRRVLKMLHCYWVLEFPVFVVFLHSAVTRVNKRISFNWSWSQSQFRI